MALLREKKKRGNRGGGNERRRGEGMPERGFNELMPTFWIDEGNDWPELGGRFRKIEKPGKKQGAGSKNGVADVKKEIPGVNKW